MKGFNWLSVALVIILLVAIPLTGCVSKGKHQILQAELEKAWSDFGNMQAKYTNLRIDYATLEEEKSDLETQLEEVQLYYDAVVAEIDTYLRGEMNSAKVDRNRAISDLNQAEGRIASLESELESTSQELHTTDIELTAILSQIMTILSDYDKAEDTISELQVKLEAIGELHWEKNATLLKALNEVLITDWASTKERITAWQNLHPTAEGVEPVLATYINVIVISLDEIQEVERSEPPSTVSAQVMQDWLIRKANATGKLFESYSEFEEQIHLILIDNIEYVNEILADD